MQDNSSLRCKTVNNHHQPVVSMAMQEAAMYLPANQRVVAPCYHTDSAAGETAWPLL